VLSGAVGDDTGNRLRVCGLVGTLGQSLNGLDIRPGRGIGGAVVARRQPLRVNDYASSRTITHDFDDMVVGQERIRSIIAVPVIVHGVARGVVWGATRAPHPIGDVTIRRTTDMVGSITRRLVAQADRDCGPTRPPELRGRALDDLAALTRSVADHDLRERLERIHRDLRGPDLPRPRASVSLAPRELEVLALVEVGASNTAIAGELSLSLQTVKAYLYAAMRKLDVSNRTSAVHRARALGLL